MGGFSGFFGSMLVLPMMLGSNLASFRVDAWESGAWTLDLGVITGWQGKGKSMKTGGFPGASKDTTVKYWWFMDEWQEVELVHG